MIKRRLGSWWLFTCEVIFLTCCGLFWPLLRMLGVTFTNCVVFVGAYEVRDVYDLLWLCSVVLLSLGVLVALYCCFLVVC